MKRADHFKQNSTTLKSVVNHFLDFCEPYSILVLPHFSLFSVVFCQIRETVYHLFVNLLQILATFMQSGDHF